MTLFTLIKKYQISIIFVLIFLIALFFRFYKLSTIPFGLNNDAAWEGSAALDILKGNISPYIPYAQEGWRGEGIIRLFVALFMLIVGNNPLSIRLASVVFGVGLIIPLFLLIRDLFGNKYALLTAFFVAISGWHITFSKTGWRAVTLPFFSTLLFYFFFKGIKNSKKFYFIAVGTTLSLVSLYTYDAARIIPFFFLFWFFIEIVYYKNFILLDRKKIFFFLLGFFITSLPMLYYAINNWQNFTSRSDFLFIGHQIEKEQSFSPLINNIITSFSLFNIRANGNDFFIFEPLIEKPISWLLPIGLLITLFFVIFKKNKEYFFMLTWFLAGLVPGIISMPNGNRAIGTIPSVYFFIALGLIFSLEWLSKFFKLKKIFIYALILLFCFYSFTLTFQNYLGNNRKELPGFYPETYITVNYINRLKDQNDYDLYFTDNFPREILTFLLYKPGQKDPFEKNYTWLEKNTDFLQITPKKNKALGFIMYDYPQNHFIANSLMAKYPKANKILLSYINENIKRPASIIILIPK